jgi:hypothetical protein
MSLTWKDFGALRESLGGIGDSVTSYLKNVQEERDRQADLDALKQFAQTPEGQRISPGLMSLAGTRSGQRVLPQLQGVMGMQREMAPETKYEQPGTVPVTRNPISGDQTVGQPLPGVHGMSLEQQDKNNYLALKAATRKNPNMALTAEQQQLLDRYDELHRQDIETAGAKAQVTGGIQNQFQQQRSNAEDARRQIEQTAKDLGTKGMSAAQDRILAAQAKLLKLFKNPDGTMKDADFSTGKPIHRSDVETELGAANNDWETARKQLNQLNVPFDKYTPGRNMPQEGQTVPKSTYQKANPGVPLSLNDGWQKHPSGFLVRDVTPQTS